MDKSHEIILTKEEKRKMDIASCRCCLLGLKDCKNCAFNFALPIIQKENFDKFQKEIEELNFIGDAEMVTLWKSCYA